MSKIVFIFVLSAFLGGVCQAQKVKYKDLLILLNAKQYDQAEPFLKRYLAENDDNPSAYLFMGIIHQEKSAKIDILKQTDRLINNIDSAILFYAKCLPKLTEKDIKKNEENYLLYTRRDLRTGEFGIKLSDIQMDIETRTKSLTEKREKVILAKRFYVEAEGQYARANSLFKTIQQKYAGEKEFYLQSDEQLIVALGKLAVVFDSSQVAFKNYKTAMQSVGKSSYNQSVELQEISNFKKDGASSADFMMDDLKLWDYSSWAKVATAKIRDEIYPLRKEINNFDLEINKVRDHVESFSLSIAKDLAKLRASNIFDHLKKLDADPLPLAIFDMKLKELDYAGEAVQQKSVANNADVSTKITIIREELKTLKQLDSLAVKVIGRDLEIDAINYKDFITSAYGTTTVLKSLIKGIDEFAKHERSRKEKELEGAIHQLKWLLVESDSIPLFQDVPEKFNHKPLVVAEDHTAGIKRLDSLSVGYFYSVSATRTADVRATFPVDPASVQQRNLPLMKGLSLAVANNDFYILFYSESKVDGKYPITLARINRQTGLAWSNHYAFELTPVELKISTINGELSIKTTSKDGDSKMVVIDAKGARLQ